MVEAQQKSSGSSGPIKAMIWTVIPMGIVGAIAQYVGIQQYLNLVGLGFLNILHILALFGLSMILLIIGGILRGTRADNSSGYPRIDYVERGELVRPSVGNMSFESIILETKSKTKSV